MDKAGDFWLGPEKGMEFGAALGWVKRDEAPQVSPCLPADAKVGGAKRSQAWLGAFHWEKNHHQELSVTLVPKLPLKGILLDFQSSLGAANISPRAS